MSQTSNQTADQMFSYQIFHQFNGRWAFRVMHREYGHVDTNHDYRSHRECEAEAKRWISGLNRRRAA